MPTTVGPSSMRMPRKSLKPTPGMLKMPSVTIAPPIRSPRSMPRKVTTGMSELRSTCTPTIRRLDRPLDVAVRT